MNDVRHEPELEAISSLLQQAPLDCDAVLAAFGAVTHLDLSLLLPHLERWQAQFPQLGLVRGAVLALGSSRQAGQQAIQRGCADVNASARAYLVAGRILLHSDDKKLLKQAEWLLNEAVKRARREVLQETHDALAEVFAKTGANFRLAELRESQKQAETRAIDVPQQGMVPYVHLFPEQGVAETRVSMTKEYRWAYEELYCVDAACNCERVLFRVVEEGSLRTVAHIGWGLDGKIAPYIDPILERAADAEEALANCRVILQSSDYRKRLVLHYHEVRDWVHGKQQKRRSFNMLGLALGSRP